MSRPVDRWRSIRPCTRHAPLSARSRSRHPLRSWPPRAARRHRRPADRRSLAAGFGRTLCPVAPSASAEPSASPAALTPLTVGLGYIPSVQFAQFYLADQAGYYRDAGLAVDLQNGRDADLVTLLGQGTFDIGNSDGTSVIPAVSQGIPIVYAATIYGQFPSVVLAKADSGIKTAADLKGKKIGTPGKYGSSWIMLQALLGSANLTTDDVTIVEYPDYGQATALQQGAVDAATGFANNEPIQLRKAGIEPVVLTVDDIVPLPGPGLVTGTATLAAKHDALAAFTAATIKAMNDIAADPQKGLDATFKAAPTWRADPELQKQILDATIATWKNTADQQSVRGDRLRRVAGVPRLHDQARPGAQPGHRGPARDDALLP